jgi:hypothetical protein
MNRPVSTVATRYGHSPDEPSDDDDEIDEEEVACVVTADDL